MRYICAITNIDRSAFFNKNNRNLSPDQRSRIREKLLITHKIQVLQGPFLFKRRQKISRAFQNLGKNGRSPN